VSFRLTHASRQAEAGGERQVEVEIGCLAVESAARQVASAPLGIGLRLAGFVAAKGKSSRQPVLHVTELEFIEGV